MPRFTVRLNGTKENPYLKLGLKRNPFPQVPRMEYMPLNNLLGKLAAEPIRDVQHLQELLKGATPEFIQGCCERFRPGEMVEFDITFPD